MICLNDVFLGREDETELLEKRYSSYSFELLTISGRRYAGKTALVREFCRNKKAVLFTAIRSDRRHNLESLSKAISKTMYRGLRSLVDFASFESAFDFVIKMSEKERVVFVIDEYQNLVETSPEIESVMKSYLSHHFQNHNILLILISSMQRTQWFPYQVSRTVIDLGPLSFFEVGKAFSEYYSDEELVELYAVTGGIPAHLSKIDVTDSIERNIDRLALHPDGAFFGGPSSEIESWFRNPEKYNAILSSMAKGKKQMAEITEESGMGSPAACSTYLSSLIDCGLVSKETPFNERKSRRSIYRISDGMVRFWFRYVQGNQSLIEYRMEDNLYSSLVKDLDEFTAGVFPTICGQFVRRNPHIFDMSVSTVDSWWDGTESIDMVVASDDMMTVMFCDCRYRDSLVDISVLESLKRRSMVVDVIGNRRYALFSKKGFTSELEEYAEENDVTLITLDDLCWL